MVPAYLPQTAVAAEWCSYQAVVQAATGKVEAHQDCAAVVQELRKPLHAQLRHDHVNAGMVRATLGEQGLRYIGSVTKVKAHTRVADVQHDPLLLRHHHGNTLADDFAKKALDRHPAPAPRLAGALAGELADVQAVLKLAGALLPLWEPVFASQPRPARLSSRAGRPTAVHKSHKWVRSGDGHQCADCVVVARSAEARKRRATESCPGYAASWAKLVGQPRGHTLMTADAEGLPLIFCAACGAWAVGRPRALLLPCPKLKARAGRVALQAIASGRAPAVGAAGGRNIGQVKRIRGF